MAGAARKFCYYRVLHDYKPPDEFRDKGYLTVALGDIIQVPRPVELEKGTEENPEGWVKGKLTKNNLEGYFPSGEFVQYIPDPPPSSSSAGPPPVKPRNVTQSSVPRRHGLSATYFMQPVLCTYCQDYIWGIGVVGVICKDCGQCFHKDCESSAVSFTSCSKTPPSKWPPVHEQEKSLLQWDINNVADWMSVVNLHRYAHIFMKKGIRGDNLSNITITKLREMNIEDEFHQRAILAAIEKLVQNKTLNTSHVAEPENALQNDHRFIVYSFSSMQQCHICGEYLWGILQQGYQCHDCGLCCHRKCAVGNLPKCKSEQMKQLRRASFTLDTVFGIQLSDQFNVAVAQAPPLVIHFTKELEKRAQEKGIKPVDSYRTTGSTGEVNRLKRLISETSVEEANLDTFDAVCLTGALKKYMRDLPNSIIHESYYLKFIQESKINDDEQCKKSLLKLTNELPAHHRSTLNYLLDHFTRCVQQQFANEDGQRDAVNKLSRVFCQILIRPPWESIVEIVFNAESSLRVVGLLLQSKLPSAAPVAKQQPRASTKPQEFLVSANEDYPAIYGGSIEDAEWYWKDITKEDLYEKMSNTPDGTFLVRNSSDGVKDNYTLAVRKGGSNRLLKIYHKDGKFSLMPPLAFNSVVDLINYYSHNSLAVFNKALDIVLVHPVCRPAPSTVIKEDMKVLRESYKRADREYNEVAKKFEKLSEEHTQLTEDLQMRHLALEALRETVALFEENRRIVTKNERLVPQSELPKAKDNFEILKRQLKAVVERYTRLDAEIKDLKATSNTKFKDMNSIKLDLQNKSELREQLSQKLLRSGETTKKLEQLVTSQEESENAAAEETTSHTDQATWLVNYDRKKAVDLLAGKPDGTFLIRPRANEPDFPYGLTIVSNGEVVHCKVGKKETGYGFADPFFIHESLVDLVLHYKDTSLVEHNDDLDVTLDFPALGTVFTKPHNKNMPQTVPRTAPAIPSRAKRNNYESWN